MKLISIVFSLIFLFSILGCCNQNERKIVSDDFVNLYDAGEDSVFLDSETQVWHQSDECICIVYGYGYNDENFVSGMNEKLYEKYGNYSESGMIFPLVFPRDFKRGSKYYISELFDYISEKNMKGLVILGAPEGTNFSLAQLQDKFEGKIPYPIFSLFSQDDILGTEYSSDFVLDKAQKAEINGVIQNEENQDFVKEVPEILLEGVECIFNSDAPFEKNAGLFEVVRKITVGLKVSRYYDPETNLPSINHFVLE